MIAVALSWYTPIALVTSAVRLFGRQIILTCSMNIDGFLFLMEFLPEKEYINAEEIVLAGEYPSV